MPQPQRESHYPAIPEESVQEGARWRHWKPSSAQVAAWFATVPLDEGMENEHYVGGVVIIPQSEKVKYTKKDGSGTVERYEMTFTPYMQIGTRIGYMRRLAEHRGLIYHPEPAKVPRSHKSDSIYFNGNMPDGLWWHVVMNEGQPVRYLCCTMQVALYDPQTYMQKLRGQDPMPMLLGTGTKQVSGGPDPNGLMKAQTGAIGRALGVAGILVVGTGIATAEDMQEFSGLAAAAPPTEQAQLPTVPSEIAPGAEPPPPTDPAEALAQLRSKALAVQTQMQERTPQAWREFVAWWQERRQREGWNTLQDVPYEALRGIVARMEELYAKGVASEPEPGSQDPGETGDESPVQALPANES